MALFDARGRAARYPSSCRDRACRASCSQGDGRSIPSRIPGLWIPGSLAQRKIDAKGVNFVANSRPGMTTECISRRKKLDRQHNEEPTDLPDGRFRDYRVQPSPQKYFASHFGRNSSIDSAIPPDKGAYRDRHGRAVDAAVSCAQPRIAGRVSRERSAAHGRAILLRTAKSCGPDAPTLASSSRMLCRPYRA
jgi:hypothetical protein